MAQITFLTAARCPLFDAAHAKLAALDVHERFVLEAALAPLRERRANLVAIGSPIENVLVAAA